MCKKMGLGQQALADAFDMKRGKVAGYFYETQPKPDFFEKLGKKFDLDIGKFLTVEMSEDNYQDFFKTDNSTKVNIANGLIDQSKNQSIFDLLMKLKKTSNEEERDSLIDEIIQMHGRTLDEVSRLKDINSALKDDLIKLLSNKGS